MWGRSVTGDTPALQAGDGSSNLPGSTIFKDLVDPNKWNLLDNPKEVGTWMWIGTDPKMRYRIQFLGTLLPEIYTSRGEAMAAAKKITNPKGRHDK